VDGQRTLLDKIAQATAARRAALTPGGSPARSQEMRAGLTYQTGDRVIDVHTGQRGTVLSGQRAVATGEEIYRVDFAGGLVSHRGRAELERDPSLAPPAAR
jgi:hypothetical protein